MFEAILTICNLMNPEVVFMNPLEVPQVNGCYVVAGNTRFLTEEACGIWRVGADANFFYWLRDQAPEATFSSECRVVEENL